MTDTALPALPPLPADAPLINTQHRHSGNGFVYNVVGYVWLGDTDEWAVLHRRRDLPNVTFCRTVANFNGNRRNGEKRYQEIT